ncbi:MAG: peptidoglycan-associated lipoprotein Pal [Acidobacteria bacterium]|nr:MAG: peptidoglycan-associated lipoprotein Pal [Acidobacteriota bacterium]
MRIRWGVCGLVIVLAVVVLGACAKKKPPVARPVPPPPPMEEPVTPAKPPAPPEPTVEKPVAGAPMKEDSMASRSLDDLNRDSPLRPLFFGYDSAEVSAEGQKVLESNGELLKKYPSWVITIEGHCDERGTAEYNLALGERRAVAARTYLVSLGIAAERVKVVSYGKEFPFDPGKTEEAYARNRRGHFVITAK